jgi:hypothetical protein
MARKDRAADLLQGTLDVQDPEEKDFLVREALQLLEDQRGENA